MQPRTFAEQFGRRGQETLQSLPRIDRAAMPWNKEKTLYEADGRKVWRVRKLQQGSPAWLSEAPEVFIVKRLRKDMANLRNLGAESASNELLASLHLNTERRNTRGQFNIAPEVYAVCQDRDHYFMAMEKLDTELFDFTNNFLANLPGRLHIPMAVDIMFLVATRILELHGRGIAHRDLSLENFMISRRADGGTTLKIIDFAQALIVRDPSQAAVGEGRVHRPNEGLPGKLRYRAPELAAANYLATKADIYALGITFYLLLTIEYPSAAVMKCGPNQADFPELLAASLAGCKRKYAQHLPQDIVDLLTEMLSPEFQTRPSAHELVARLQRIQHRAKQEQIQEQQRVREEMQQQQHQQQHQQTELQTSNNTRNPAPSSQAEDAVTSLNAAAPKTEAVVANSTDNTSQPYTEESDSTGASTPQARKAGIPESPAFQIQVLPTQQEQQKEQEQEQEQEHQQKPSLLAPAALSSQITLTKTKAKAKISTRSNTQGGPPKASRAVNN